MKAASRIFFALVLIALGILGLSKGDFAPGWTPVPASLPGREFLVYLSAAMDLGTGIGLLVPRIAAVAARILFVWLLIWLVALRIPWMIVDFGVGTWWSASSTAIITATAWLLLSRVSAARREEPLGFIVGSNGVRIARALFGLGLIPIGLAHFLYLDNTAPFVPAWMQWPVFWAYFTGAAFIAAGLAIIVGVFGRLAATLVTCQIAILTLIVWLPKVVVGDVTPFQWGEFVVSILLTACAWVVAASYDRPQEKSES